MSCRERKWLDVFSRVVGDMSQGNFHSVVKRILVGTSRARNNEAPGLWNVEVS
jgi:hypothetical protein